MNRRIALLIIILFALVIVADPTGCLTAYCEKQRYPLNAEGLKIMFGWVVAFWAFCFLIIDVVGELQKDGDEQAEEEENLEKINRLP